MNKEELLHIISLGENEQTEFKTSFNREVIETIVAFANKKGGNIYVGISKTNSIVGVNTNEESIQNWQNEIKSKTQPAIFPEIASFTVENKTIVRIYISEYPVKPVSLQGRYFIRKNNSNHLLSVNEINDIYLQSTQTSWDSYPYADALYSDFDEDKILNFIEKVNKSGRFKLIGTPYECLQKLRLLKNNIPTNAAMLMFSKNELFYNVHIGRFKTQSHIIDDKMVRGTLFEAVDNTMIFIISHLKVAFEITGKTSQRTEIFEYPLPAIREMVLNAIIHRDYKSPTDIQVRIFDKEITIFNPGKLYGGLTIEDLKTDNYQAQSRNKLITEAFYLTKDIEKYGSGYRRIREYISDYPTMYFDFEENSGGFLTKIGYSEQNFLERNEFENEVADNVTDVTDNVTDVIDNVTDVIDNVTDVTDNVTDVIDNVTDNVIDNVTDNVIDNVTDVIDNVTDVIDVAENVTDNRYKQIINLIKNHFNISTAEISEKLGVSKRTILRDIEKLKTQNKITRIGSEKSGHWQIIE